MTDRLDELTHELRAFVAEREWEQFHDPKNLAMALASEAGELLAVLRWVRGDQSDAFVRTEPGRGRLADELADVAISVLLLADRTGLDLVQVVRDKLARNRVRYPVELSRGKAERPPSSGGQRP